MAARRAGPVLTGQDTPADAGALRLAHGGITLLPLLPGTHEKAHDSASRARHAPFQTRLGCEGLRTFTTCLSYPIYAIYPIYLIYLQRLGWIVVMEGVSWRPCR